MFHTEFRDEKFMLCLLLGRIEGLWEEPSFALKISETVETIPSKSSSVFWLKDDTGLSSFHFNWISSDLERQKLGPAIAAGDFRTQKSFVYR